MRSRRIRSDSRSFRVRQIDEPSLRRAACSALPAEASSSMAAPWNLRALKRRLILQDFGLMPWKTVEQNAALGLQVRRLPLRKKAYEARP